MTTPQTGRIDAAAGAELASNGGGRLLEGITVLEMSHQMAGPVCGLMLADMGADVIKVERLPLGDDIRRSAPFVDDHSAPFAMMNRNKRSLAINMRDQRGRDVLRRLLSSSDVFFENYRRGAMAHYGIAYPDIAEEAPQLVYLSLSGFGQTGPYKDRGGFDLVTQGMSGLMSVTGEGEGRPPVKVGAPVTDITAGLISAMGILGALVQRGRTGKGQFLDTSLFEAGVVQTYWQQAIYLSSGVVPQAMGSAHPLIAPYQAFPTADGWVNVGSANQATWEKLTAVLDQKSLADDPRFVDSVGRITNRLALEAELIPLFKTATTDEWLERLEEAGVPAGPVLDIAQVAADPHAEARGLFRTVNDPKGPSQRVIGHPVHYSAAETTIERPAPALGAHSREVLLEKGVSLEEISSLIREGAVGVAD